MLGIFCLPGVCEMEKRCSRKAVKAVVFNSCAAVLLLLLSATPLFSQPEKSSYSVKDSTGKQLSFSSPPQRIISTSPGITEMLFSLGAGPEVIAVTNNCNYPPEASKKISVGDMLLDTEKIIALTPDLIIVDANLRMEQMRKFESIGLPVFSINCSGVATLKESIRQLGKALKKEKRAVELCTEIDTRIAKIRNRVATAASSGSVTVFVEIWDKPLMTAGKNTFFNELIEIAGGLNTFADSKTAFPTISVENLIEKNPEVIILTTSSRDGVLNNSIYKGIRAVKSSRVHAINPDIIARPTPRMVEALELLALWLHPEIRSITPNCACLKRPGPPKVPSVSTNERIGP